MGFDPAIFGDFNDLSVGDRVRFQKVEHGVTMTGEAVVALVWMGLEEMCTLKTDAGARVIVCRAIGDTVERVA